MGHYGLGSYLEWQLTWTSLSGRSTRWSIMGWAPVWSGSSPGRRSLGDQPDGALWAGLLSGVAVDLDVALREINQMECKMGSCLEWQLTWMSLSRRSTRWSMRWAPIWSGIALWEINQMECEMGSYLKWQLHKVGS